MLSLAFIATLSASAPGVPFTFILKGEALPPLSLTLDRLSFLLLVLKILKPWVTDPELINTVSNESVSTLVLRLASGLVINDSFRHEKNTNIEMKISAEIFKLF